jgi:predicted membrane metal-binding protein
MSELDGVHERISRDDTVEGSSNRAFGLTFAVVFVLVASWPLLRGRPIRWWALTLSVLFLVSAIVVPHTLEVLNRAWLALSRLLHRVATPVIMALLFVTTVIPIALVLRALGKDSLRLERDPAATTYWIDRRPPGPAPETMARQF